MSEILRSVALLPDGKYLPIEYIYRIDENNKDGLCRINIPERLSEVRALAKEGKLICPCGCGGRMTVVAGDTQERHQHFRLLSDTTDEKSAPCSWRKTYASQIDTAVLARDLLKAWFEGLYKCESTSVGNGLYRFVYETCNQYKNRLYFWLRRKDIEAAEQDRSIYIVDYSNALSFDGQYPEYLMKIQKKQGYCLFVDSQSEAPLLYAFLYLQKRKEDPWIQQEILHADLSSFRRDKHGRLSYGNVLLYDLAKKVRDDFYGTRPKSSTKKFFKKKEEKPPAKMPVCPECGKPLAKKTGKFGEFWGCSGFPECKYTIKI